MIHVYFLIEKAQRSGSMKIRKLNFNKRIEFLNDKNLKEYVKMRIQEIAQ